MAALDFVLPHVLCFRPDIILYQSGVDRLDTDQLGHLSLANSGLECRDRRVMRMLHAVTIFVVTLGGGYSIPIDLTAEAHANVYRAAWEILEKMKVRPVFWR